MRLLLLAAVLAVGPVAAQSSTPPETGSVAETATGTLTGTVTDAETGAPLVGAGVVLPDLGIGAVVQRNGTFTIEDVPPGTHRVRAGAFRYHPVLVEVAVGDGPLAFRLGAGAEGGCADHDHGVDAGDPEG